MRKSVARNRRTAPSISANVVESVCYSWKWLATSLQEQIERGFYKYHLLYIWALHEGNLVHKSTCCLVKNSVCAVVVTPFDRPSLFLSQLLLALLSLKNFLVLQASRVGSEVSRGEHEADIRVQAHD